MNVEWTTRTNDHVTLVEVIVTNDGPPRRVRISNELDGPVWPPRTQGIPAPGWNEHGYEGRVKNRRVLGYSTPAPAVEPPVSVEWLESAGEEKQQFNRHPSVPSIDPDPTPNSVSRALGDPRPPRDAVPVLIESVTDERRVEKHERAQTEGGMRTETQEMNHPAVRSLFETIERRIDDGEMLTEVETLPDATWAVETVGGLTAVADLTAALNNDRETLQAIEERAARLRERAEQVDVPVDTLERLA
jgi:hypothetical protein